MIGEVARDFGLYTKITGGQRIDLFGARVEQLPAIWRRLVDAGFESGHAYGKALRTVKSCVGSTWCRYGVQDSVGLAIDARAALPRAALAAQAQGRRLRLRPRVRRGARQGLRRHRHRERLEPLRRRQRRRRPRRTPSCSPATSTPRRWSATSTGSSCSTSAPPTGCSAPPPGSRRSTAASTTCARSSSTTRSASAPSWRRRWPATSTPTSTSGRPPWTTPRSCAASSRSSTRPDTPDPHITLPRRARPDRPGRLRRAGARSARPSRWGRPMTARPGAGDAGLPRRRLEVEGGVAALVDGEAVAIFRTHDGDLYAIGNHDPVRTGLGAVPRHRRHPRRRPDRRLADAQAGLRPAHRAVPRRRGGPGPDVRRAGRRRRRPRRSPTASRRVRDRATCPLDRLPDRRHRGPQGRGAGRAAGAPRRRRSSGRPALSLDPNHVDDDELRAATEEVLARPVDMFLATTGIGMKAWFEAAEAWGLLDDAARRRSARPRSWPAGPKSVGALRRRGLRELWAPESECFEDVLDAPARPRPRPACGSSCRSTASRCRWSPTRCAGRAPT